VARKPKKQLTQDEVVTMAAQGVVGTVNPFKMGITPEEVDIDRFVELFKEKANEMLETQDALLIKIGPEITIGGSGIYSDDFQPILDYIEEKMQIKYEFYYGILIYLRKTDVGGVWLPH